MIFPVVVGSVETEARHSEKELGWDSLAARLADGDPGASREIVERHYAELYRYAFRMLRDDPAAEDAVHDAFERAFRALGRYPEKRIRSMTLRPWLYRITLNVVRNRVRRRREVTVGNVSALSPEARADEGGVRRVQTVQGVPAGRGGVRVSKGDRPEDFFGAEEAARA